MSFFEPILGSSFDSLAAQRQFWAQHNAGVDTGNVNRATAAQDQVNNYFQNIAAQRQQAMNQNAQTQWAQQQQADAEAEARARQAQHNYEFNQNLQLSKDEIARREAEAAQRDAMATQTLSEKQREYDTNLELSKKQAEDELNNTGQAFATAIASSKRQLDAAQQTADDLQAEHDRLTKTVTEIGGQKNKTDDDLKTLSAANARLSELKKMLPHAIALQNRLEQKHYALSDNLSARGFVADDESGRLTHLTTGKTWTFQGALKKARDSSTQPPPTFLGMPLTQQSDAAPATTDSTGTDNYFDGGASAVSPAPLTETGTSYFGAGPATPTVVTQQQYDALPSGSTYRDANGNLRRKK